MDVLCDDVWGEVLDQLTRMGDPTSVLVCRCVARAWKRRLVPLLYSRKIRNPNERPRASSDFADRGHVDLLAWFHGRGARLASGKAMVRNAARNGWNDVLEWIGDASLYDFWGSRMPSRYAARHGQMHTLRWFSDISIPHDPDAVRWRIAQEWTPGGCPTKLGQEMQQWLADMSHRVYYTRWPHCGSWAPAPRKYSIS